MPSLNENMLDLDRCPHCSIDKPSLSAQAKFSTWDYRGAMKQWVCYSCARCGGVVSGWASNLNYDVRALYPSARTVNEAIPATAREYLRQAINAASAPVAAIVVTASAVDAMLKARGLVEGSLYVRINEASKKHLITEAMSQWAHHVRLEANDQRHADQEVDFPTEAQAAQCLEFALALGEFLFVLPSRVTRGLTASNTQPASGSE
jgi:hypothetical protein